MQTVGIYFVPKSVNIEPGLLESFKRVAGTCFLRHSIQGVANKVSSEVVCHFLSNGSESECRILHTYYQFLST